MFLRAVNITFAEKGNQDTKSRDCSLAVGLKGGEYDTAKGQACDSTTIYDVPKTNK